MKYPFESIELKWQKYWKDKKVFKTDLTKIDNKLYVLVMFIYPSAAKMHIGHWYNYGPTDSFARYKKLKGFNVFEPMGYDAFGLPAENYAIKTGIHPQDSTLKNIKDIRSMLDRMGGMYDWDAELMTCVPEYYKWNQWLFLQLYKKGLAYRKNAPVNWCPSCQTVLAREQVLGDGGCERCGTTVIQKNLTQWFFKITEYADELLDGLNKIDWPEKTKTMQINWIGKSYGTEIDFSIEGSDEKIRVFTTRPDTLFGVTYVVLAPENELVQKITKPEYKDAVDKYIESIKSLTEVERTSTTKEKTGVPTGAYAINPINGEKVPIWIADYVLATYGTGCVMAVPGHDERDFEFAKKFNLPIKKVILQPGTNEEDELKEAYTDVGVMINSGKYNGLSSDVGIEKISEDIEKQGLGKRTVNYRLRDWLISRQRYWGTPIPVIHCDKCGEVPVPEDQLPVVLPYEVNFKPDGGSPLASCEEFINTTCPECGAPARRDPDTMDTFVDSSWYYLRYLNPRYEEGMFDSELANNWVPVDVYVGGAEHATMHLLYARFIHKFLRDIGLVNSDEPFQKLIHQGTITNQGAKMSKSKGNVVDPNEFLEKYGSDVFRMYLMFMGPYELGGDWSDKGIVGVDRFVQRTYTLFENYRGIASDTHAKSKYDMNELSDDEKKIYQKVNQTLAKVDSEIDNFRFNTAVAALMELLNELKNIDNCRKEIQVYTLERFASMLAPLAPHLGEECWSLLGKEKSIYEKPVWFEPDAEALINETVTVVVQVNGKVRAKIELPVDTPEREVKNIVFNDDKIKGYVDGKQIVKEIYVPNKIYNIVVK
ncbi:leucyl-tRNA synthetase [Melioribacter roseus P3M-2]|uniref:Leucine--tRNA ligase n=1 Tax=Melioribacter roseus (strain DSM 23840 / JCM 17771 / VKM B-2668 / P3M-2) TaxID=1191523 RepID=I7A0K7_MELRP|nr:leucine--tRNA ligase [Melioribacter roseus]AFN74788.1 leucyl-tRNA synthetase [Melioribacter roseus P3M-2]